MYKFPIEICKKLYFLKTFHGILGKSSLTKILFICFTLSHHPFLNLHEY